MRAVTRLLVLVLVVFALAGLASDGPNLDFGVAVPLINPRRQAAPFYFIPCASPAGYSCGDGTAPPIATLTDFGSAGRGNDDTAVFQKALQAAAAAGAILEVPLPAKFYRTGTLNIPSNTRMYLDPGVVVEALPGFGPNDNLVRIWDVDNVEIVGPGAVFRMLKAEYTDGEYRHCFSVKGARNVHLAGISGNDSGGDGLFVGQTDRGPSQNIYVDDCTFDNNRRQGMSVISAQTVWVKRTRFTNTFGAEPENGVDLEPNAADNFMQDIHFEDCVTAGNAGNGISFGLPQLKVGSAPVSITVLRHHSIGNGQSGYFAGYESTAPVGVQGTVLVQDSVSESEGAYGAEAAFYNANGPSLTFKNVFFFNPNQRGQNLDSAALCVRRGGGGVGKLGNIHFLESTVKDISGKIEYYFTFRDYSNIGFENIEFRNPSLLIGASNTVNWGLLQGQAVNTVGN